MIQVSSVPEQTGLSSAVQQRQVFFDRALSIAKSSSAPAWMQTLRDRAAVLAQDQAFPTTRNEEWRSTDLSDLVALALTGIEHQTSIDIAPYILPEAAGSRLTFVNGRYAPELSVTDGLPPELTIGSLANLNDAAQIEPYLAKQPGAEEIFTALNTAGLTDGAIVLLPKNLTVAPPIHLLYITVPQPEPLMVQPRCLVVANAHSSVTLIEEHLAIGQGAYFTNGVTEIWLEENAGVNHTRIQRDSGDSFHIGKTAVSQARSSRYTCNAINLGAKLSRHNLEIYQTGEETETTLNGLTLIRNSQLADTHSAIVLTQPHGTTRQLHKCIVDDRAHAVFNGKVFVPKAAQMTNAAQLNRNLLLSPHARIDTKPQLEIVADNVKCTHGATVGQLEADQLFYLLSRGIDAESAKKLLVYAFAFEILEQIAIDSLRQTLSQLVSAQTSP